MNPIHSGHINYLREAKKLGDRLIVIVNSDEQVKLKGSIPFMNERERMKIISELKSVDAVFLAIDRDTTIAKSLAAIKPDIFAKGGDRNPDNLPQSEIDVCQKNDIEIIYNVGGGKTQSSSWLIEKVQDWT